MLHLILNLLAYSSDIKTFNCDTWYLFIFIAIDIGKSHFFQIRECWVYALEKNLMWHIAFELICDITSCSIDFWLFSHFPWTNEACSKKSLIFISCSCCCRDVNALVVLYVRILSTVYLFPQSMILIISFMIIAGWFWLYYTLFASFCVIKSLNLTTKHCHGLNHYACTMSKKGEKLELISWHLIIRTQYSIYNTYAYILLRKLLMFHWRHALKRRLPVKYDIYFFLSLSIIFFDSIRCSIIIKVCVWDKKLISYIVYDNRAILCPLMTHLILFLMLK